MFRYMSFVGCCGYFICHSFSGWVSLCHNVTLLVICYFVICVVVSLRHLRHTYVVYVSLCFICRLLHLYVTCFIYVGGCVSCGGCVDVVWGC